MYTNFYRTLLQALIRLTQHNSCVCQSFLGSLIFSQLSSFGKCKKKSGIMKSGVDAMPLFPLDHLLRQLLLKVGNGVLNGATSITKWGLLNNHYKVNPIGEWGESFVTVMGFARAFGLYLIRTTTVKAFLIKSCDRLFL